MKKLIVVAVMCVLCVGLSQAVVVNVDLEKGNAPVTFSGQGAYADAGNDFWNSAGSGNAVGLLASDGVTGTGFSIATGSGSAHDWASASQAMLGDYNYTRDNPSTISITGLAASTDYLVYAYLGGDNEGQITTLTLNGVTVTQTTAYQGFDYVEGVDGNYFIMNLTTDATGALTGSYDAAAGRYGAIRGMQIVGEIPEPATMLLLGLGSLVSLRRRRKV